MPFPGYYDPTATQVAADNIAYAGLSSKLWRDVPQSVMANNPGDGYFHLQRFSNWVNLTTETSNSEATMSYLTGGQCIKAVVNYPGAEGPTLEVDSEDTDNQGVESLQFNGQVVTPKAGYDIIFEARVAIDTDGTPQGLVVHDATLGISPIGHLIASGNVTGHIPIMKIWCFPEYLPAFQVCGHE